MGQPIVLFGGSFDPVHHGHLIIARAVAETLGVDRVILLPAGRAPHKPGGAVASGADRAAMVHRAIEDDPLFALDSHDLDCDGPCYTVRTVEHFRTLLGPAADLFWLIGADSLLELHEWYQPARIARACRIVTAARPGFDPGPLHALRTMLDPDRFDWIRRDILPTPRIDISATDIRHRVATGQSIRYLTPRSVEQYINDRSLYQSSPGSSR